jgi:DNA oxidative demethylase
MAAYQPDLFGEPSLLPGLRFTPEFVSRTEEAELAGRIDASDLAPFKFHGWEGKRLTASFGHSYDFARGKLDAALPVPGWLLPLRKRAASYASLQPEALSQVLVIRYDPGARIGWHRDRPQFGVVVGLSLGSPAVLRLRRRTLERFERRTLPLPPRSLYLLAGEARHEWEHSIAPLDETRWSITFRTLAPPREHARKPSA